MKILFGIAAFLAALTAHAQPATAYGCNSSESRQFDFWIGDWELSYVEDGKPGKSRNRVTTILDGCVVLEEFSGSPGTKLDGKSFSTFDRASKTWKQTWVDNTASYLDFSGGMSDGKMILAREAVQKDGGKTWATQLEIDYKRVK